MHCKLYGFTPLNFNIRKIWLKHIWWINKKNLEVWYEKFRMTKYWKHINLSLCRSFYLLNLDFKVAGISISDVTIIWKISNDEILEKWICHYLDCLIYSTWTLKLEEICVSDMMIIWKISNDEILETYKFVII